MSFKEEKEPEIHGIGDKTQAAQYQPVLDSYRCQFQYKQKLISHGCWVKGHHNIQDTCTQVKQRGLKLCHKYSRFPFTGMISMLPVKKKKIFYLLPNLVR